MRGFRPLPARLQGIGFCRRDALSLGVADHRLRYPDLSSPVGRGVRVPSQCPAPQLEAARALAARYPGVVVSHRSAALALRLRVPAHWGTTTELWLTRGDNTRALRRPGVVCRRGLLAREDVVHVEGVPVTSPLRTFLDVCAELSVTEAVVLADGLVNTHRYGIRRGVPPVCRPEEIDAAVRAHTGRRGIRTARAAADLMRVGSDSPAETRLRLLLEDHGVHGLTLDHPLFDAGGNLVAQPDLALESHRLSLQYEGSHHEREGQRVRDIRRMRATEAAGWREVRICSEDLHRYVVTTQGPVPVAVALVWEAIGAARRC
ncbi:hypothetical protein ACH9EU_16315 [Kocuria sp. M1R5S2]|uniref:hypothetical protein n=1 Tax=Kocuria rhizosphaerae TaxID=3376285 RepID=UPI00379BD5A9